MTSFFTNIYSRIVQGFGPSKPPVGTATPPQATSKNAGTNWSGSSGSLKPPERTIETYREMRRVPTIALARMVATAPVKAAPWSYEARDGTPDDRVAFVQAVIQPILYQLVKDACLSLDYGFQAFERVWEVRDGRLVYKRLKALAPDDTDIMVVKSTGDFAGIRQGPVLIGPQKAFVFTNDGEYDNFYGRSRNENIRETAYAAWMDTFKKLAKYTAKAAGTTPMIRYPIGQADDRDGSVQDNFVLAQMILEHLGNGHGVTMPQIAGKYAEALIERNIDPKSLAAWSIEFIEPSRNHGDEMLNMLRYWDALQCRGWLVPERAATEASVSGSRADSEGAGDMVLTAADETLTDLAEMINREVVNPLLVYNFGESAKGSVTMVPGALGDADKANIATLVNGVLTNPVNIDLLLQAIDFDAALDRLGYPKANEVVDLRTPVATGDKTETPAIPAVVDAVAKVDDAPANATPAGLNGAQIQSAQSTLTAYSEGTLAKEAAYGLLVAVGLDPSAAHAMIEAQSTIVIQPDTGNEMLAAVQKTYGPQHAK
jgi:hypothetical protein